MVDRREKDLGINIGTVLVSEPESQLARDDERGWTQKKREKKEIYNFDVL